MCVCLTFKILCMGRGGLKSFHIIKAVLVPISFYRFEKKILYFSFLLHLDNIVDYTIQMLLMLITYLFLSLSILGSSY